MRAAFKNSLGIARANDALRVTGRLSALELAPGHQSRRKIRAEKTPERMSTFPALLAVVIFLDAIAVLNVIGKAVRR